MIQYLRRKSGRIGVYSPSTSMSADVMTILRIGTIKYYPILKRYFFMQELLFGYGTMLDSEDMKEISKELERMNSWQ